ncbi:carnitine-acylcarnitine carrier-like protein [Leptotrombidium deliense]|uniref:Carnitine-acylcarnitine carrier-like protein n=1 Tax=Leptotrombidium deliense TaxID=299467 RepID=A0A443SDM1_9ACAR|nr:carnitine-acylcarnitine carrier-like protein [Leptotrombidium deliense]
MQLQKLHFNESQNICISGGIAGIVYWLIALPFDILKSRIQTNQKDEKILTEFSKLLKREGLLSMYRGVDAVLVRAFPVNAIVFYAYEITLNLWQKFTAPKSITSHNK